MTLDEAKEVISNSVISALKCIKLEAGERCPCCGRKKSAKHTKSEKMIEANRLNIQRALEARKIKQK